MFNHAIAYVLSVVTDAKRDEEGATAVEYALIVAGIAVGLVLAVGVFGGALQDFFENLAGQVGIGGGTTPPVDD